MPTKHTKPLLILLTTFLALLILLPTPAHADEKSYSIPSAAFTLEILPTGQVQVTETWTLRYTSGTFTRFYKDIYRNVPAEEAFTLAEDSMTVTIDGYPCARTVDNLTRPNHTFYLGVTPDAYTYECYLPSKNQTRVYQITYTLENAVKLVDNTYNLLTLRLIPANFSKEVDTVSATVIAPAGSTLDLRNAEYFDTVDASGSTATITADGWKGVFKIKVRIDGASISGTAPLRGSDLTNKENDMETKTGRHLRAVLVLLLMAAMPLVFIFIGLLLLYSKIDEIRTARAIKNTLQIDPYHYLNLVKDWRTRLDPFEFAFGSGRGMARRVFYAVLESLFYKGILQSNDGDLVRLNSDDHILPAEKSALDFLLQQGTTPDGSLSMNCFYDTIQKTPSTLRNFETDLKKSIAETVSARLSADEKKQYKKDWKMLSAYASYYTKNKLDTNYMESDCWPYFMAFIDWQSPNPFAVYDSAYLDQCGPILTSYMDNDREIYRSSSSSSGSSCSSCSSCSGCGGGGAD